jgi:hypothetical protein
MFDGVNQHAGPPDRRSKPGKPINTHAMLPVLRVQASRAAVEFLSYACAYNTMEAARWAALRWGLDPDILDPAHPDHEAAADPASPVSMAADALTSLVEACHRFKTITGGDGIALAHATMLRQFGQTLADHVLDRLLECSIEFLIDSMDEKTIQPPPGEPTAADRAEAARAALDHMCEDEPLAGLRGPLDALEAAARAGSEGSSPATLCAVYGLRAALKHAAREGMSMDDLRFVLNTWTKATGGPPITLTR